MCSTFSFVRRAAHDSIVGEPCKGVKDKEARSKSLNTAQ